MLQAQIIEKLSIIQIIWEKRKVIEENPHIWGQSPFADNWQLCSCLQIQLMQHILIA